MVLTRHWVEQWRRNPDAVVISSAIDDTRLTGGDVDRLTTSVARGFTDHGVRSGDRPC